VIVGIELIVEHDLVRIQETPGKRIRYLEHNPG
jgi:hypothetical protein